MTIGQSQRREDRRDRFETEFPDDADVGLDLIDLTELAWHDCYDDVTFPDDVLDDILVVANGSIQRLVEAALLAVRDRRDLRAVAERKRT